MPFATFILYLAVFTECALTLFYIYMYAIQCRHASVCLFQSPLFLGSDEMVEQVELYKHLLHF